MDDDFGMKDQLDVIFCRNVIIYFDLPTQYDLMKKFCENLTEGGFLFIGHSETLNRMDLPLKQAAPMVYRKVCS
jgi:chemotaxis protein methyltransferase CheR